MLVIGLLLSFKSFNTLVIVSRTHNCTCRNSSVKQRALTEHLSTQTKPIINYKNFLISNENKTDNPQCFPPTVFWQWIWQRECISSVSIEICLENSWIMDESQVFTLNYSWKQLHIWYWERSRNWQSAQTSSKTSN